MPDLKKMLTLEALSEALPSWLKRSTKPEYNADEIDSTLTTNQFVTASDKDNWNAKGTYSKPSGGIPKSDLSSIVQTSLEKADSALQSETDPTVPSWAKQSSKPSYNSDEISDTNRSHKFATQTQLNQISTNQSNILSVEDMVCATEFSSSTAYAVGDMVTYEHKLYKFINAHQGAWSASDVQNYDLTRLEAEDRASLAEVVDSGAKNKLKISGVSATVGEAVFTVSSDGTISVYTTATTTTQRSLTITASTDGVTLNANDIVSGVPSSDNKVSIEWGIGASGNTKSLWGNNTEGYTTVGYTGSVRYFAVVISSGKSISSSSPLVFKPMVCTKAAFGVSSKFVPYRPNWDLVSNRATGYTIDSSSDSNSELLQRVCEYLGADKNLMHTGLISVSTDTLDEYCLYYFQWKYSGVNRIIKIINSTVTITAINSWGTVAVGNGTPPYHIGVTFLT